MLVGLVVRLVQDPGTLGAGVADAPVDVGHLEADVDHAVAVRRWWSSSWLSGLTPPMITKRQAPLVST